MKPAIQPTYTPQPWVNRMIADLDRLAQTGNQEKCEELRKAIEGGLNSRDAARRFRELKQ